MPRSPRAAVGGMVYHVLNRANARMQIFDSRGDYEAFERVLAQAHERVAMRTAAYSVMPSHWHLVLWPRADGDLSEFMRWLTVTHTQRWHAAAGTAGTGHLYQGRFKSFPIQSDTHYLRVCRYVERNALRAGLVRRAENWRWCSLWRRQSGDAAQRALLHPGPVRLPADWVALVNQPLSREELDALRLCVNRGRPYGGPIWTKRTAARLGLESTLRPRGRPRKDRPLVSGFTSEAQHRG
ncbi:MAG: transposase, partial [Planctomycetota bacterium]